MDIQENVERLKRQQEYKKIQALQKMQVRFGVGGRFRTCRCRLGYALQRMQVVLWGLVTCGTHYLPP